MAAADFPAVAARLQAILEPYGDRLMWQASPSGDAKLERAPGGKPWDYVAGIRVGKTYVSYYLMPVYGMPGLLDGISPELSKRMQGKACFNFTRVDEPLFTELAALTATGIDRYRDFQPPERTR